MFRSSLLIMDHEDRTDFVTWISTSWLLSSLLKETIITLAILQNADHMMICLCNHFYELVGDFEAIAACKRMLR